MMHALPKDDSHHRDTVSRFLRKRTEQRYPGSRPMAFFRAASPDAAQHFQATYVVPGSFDFETAVASREHLLRDLRNALPDAQITACCDSKDSDRLGFNVFGSPALIYGNIRCVDSENYPEAKAKAR